MNSYTISTNTILIYMTHEMSHFFPFGFNLFLEYGEISFEIALVAGGLTYFSFNRAISKFYPINGVRKITPSNFFPCYTSAVFAYAPKAVVPYFSRVEEVIKSEEHAFLKHP